MFFRSTDPNAPRRGVNRRDDKRVLNHGTGDAGRDGYTRLSQASRESGYREPVGSTPEYFGRRPVE